MLTALLGGEDEHGGVCLEVFDPVVGRFRWALTTIAGRPPSTRTRCRSTPICGRDCPAKVTELTPLAVQHIRIDLQCPRRFGYRETPLFQPPHRAASLNSFVNNLRDTPEAQLSFWMDFEYAVSSERN